MPATTPETAPDTGNSLTPEQAAQMEQQLSAYRAAQAAAESSARATKLKPITDVLASSEWTTVKTALTAASPALIDEPFFDSIRALINIMSNMPAIVR